MAKPQYCPPLVAVRFARIAIDAVDYVGAASTGADLEVYALDASR